MLTISSIDADNIITVIASGWINHLDIESQLLPSIEAKLQDHATIRLWYEFSPEFEGISVGALWDDAMLSLFHLSDFSRVVMIADMEKLDAMVNALAFMLPCPVKIFAMNERDRARVWLDEVVAIE